MGVNIESLVVTCDECKTKQLKLETPENISIYGVHQISALIKAVGWYASANCGYILCPACWEREDDD